MNDTFVSIRATALSKAYKIYDNPSDRLKQFVFNGVRAGLGKDPKFYHKEFSALDNVSFEVKKGQTIGIVGRNGAGKSTLLQMICGTLTPSSGQVEVNGRVAALLELGSGFNPEFTGRQNVFLNASVLGLEPDQIEERFDDICAFAEIGDFIEQPVKTYSSGMMVRLAFAVIAHVDADILIIDEALAVGDAYFGQKCMRFLRDFMEEGSVLFVSHDTGSVVSLCDQAIYLETGTVKMTGTPKEVTEKYLQDLYESQQGAGALETPEETTPKKEISKTPVTTSTTIDEPLKDCRLDLINNSKYRNDIELFSFSEKANSFGKRGATVTNVAIFNEQGEKLAWAVGSTVIKLKIECDVHSDLFAPIIGFQFKDKLGQILFADNTYLTYSDSPLHARAGSTIAASFEFYLPLLPSGEYSISPAIATGTQQEHVQHHWVHDALILNVQSTSVPLGLMGLQMKQIDIKEL